MPDLTCCTRILRAAIPLLILPLHLVSGVLVGLVVPMAPAAAQIPGLPLPAAPSVPPDSPSGVAEAVRPGRAVVTFDNKNLFSLTADSRREADDRADLVSLRLSKVLTEIAAGEAPRSVSVRQAGDNVVLMLGETPLLTVTQSDADAADASLEQLAGDWQDRINSAFTEAQRERSPAFFRDAAIAAAWTVGIAFLLNFIVWFAARRFFDRPGLAVQLLVWLVALNHIADLFPQTRPLHNAIRAGVLRPLFIVLIVSLGAAALSRLLGVILKRVFPPLPDTLSPEERTVRNLRRRATLGTVARVTGVTVIWMVSVVVALTWIGINLPALLASAGLIGVGIGLATQDSMKDLVAGVNILIDDRFGVGDVIRVGEHEGTVEKLNLRITQIRDLSGRVITFPNRAIETVVNSTLRWAQVNFAVGVAYDTDLRHAMRVLEETALQLQQDWPERIIEVPQLLGVDSYNPSDITLRILVRTLPGDQWTVGRELRLRVKEAFDSAGIVIAFPQIEVTLNDRKTVPSPAEEAATTP